MSTILSGRPLALALFVSVVCNFVACNLASAEECLPRPGHASSGHWYYRVDGERHCWYLAAAGRHAAKPHSQNAEAGDSKDAKSAAEEARPPAKPIAKSAPAAKPVTAPSEAAAPASHGPVRDALAEAPAAIEPPAATAVPTVRIVAAKPAVDVDAMLASWSAQRPDRPPEAKAPATKVVAAMAADAAEAPLVPSWVGLALILIGGFVVVAVGGGRAVPWSQIGAMLAAARRRRAEPVRPEESRFAFGRLGTDWPVQAR